MNFNRNNFEMLLGGSHVDFKRRERAPLSEQECDLKLENEGKLQGGIRILRKMRTQALNEQNPVACQNILKEAHQFSDRMAEVILGQALEEKPFPIDVQYIETLQQAQSEYADQEASSGRGLPPQSSIQNLFRAVDDMLTRIEEKTQSIKTPDHKLTQEEMNYVLHEFLRGANDLTIKAREKFFEKNTKIGGILSGGSVYLELVKKIIERYGDPSLVIDSFVIAVDKDGKRIVLEASEPDTITQTIIVTDDIIDRGGTLLTALWATGQQFPNATIYSGLGTDYPGGFEKRRMEKHKGHLEMLVQDFIDLPKEEQSNKALAFFDQAESYAKENNVTLQAGWYKRKERIINSMNLESQNSSK